MLVKNNCIVAFQFASSWDGHARGGWIYRAEDTGTGEIRNFRAEGFGERIDVQTLWRLALMFDAPGSSLADLGRALAGAGDSIRQAARDNPVRMGVADRHPDLGQWVQRVAGDNRANLDGAVEVSLAANLRDTIPEICGDLRPIMANFCDLASVDVMTGPMFNMVPVRSGGTFLSLAFRRDPALTSWEFRDWWRYQHSQVAIPVLGDPLLAYDQVHVEQDASIDAAQAFGSGYTAYDAYDNLTWDDRYGYLHSISDKQAMAPVYADEVGRIDPVGRRSAIMTTID